ncbi:NADH:flavin oxidoreductase/NADH oxidase [Variovorax sp. ZS18.2.2]|uniref:NADH:flavin oxidoreductase/NADH oxidase n=1 Tax=Variovorax sp. ZS18.2.2 TaxID=2971255 RepID=UPI002150DB98|nr:NADH:flavin oxidoreductase/NADH oxidase [Variovorax sp. ZS18.2.2]MCR6476429.1 NADH:flavin oxidoreductase/NADH oxidase [Variovorax sp. ZS18.2.2]
MTNATLFTPLAIRGVTLRNRIVMSPMCQYSASDGMADDWHLVHLGSRAVGGAGLIMVEATAVSPEGRITPGCLGLWNDAQIEPLARIAHFIKRQGAVPGIQLAHAGRKGSCRASWEGGAPLPPGDGGWELLSASEMPFGPSSPAPRMASVADIAALLCDFANAARRAVAAGFEIVELHAAHGYLLHQFLSPLSNKRCDAYGGSPDGRSRLLIELVPAVREVIPSEMPLFVRISATDWIPGGWEVDDAERLCVRLEQHGVDLIDVSSGGLRPDAQIPVGPNYQVPLAGRVRRAAGIRTGAVGLITQARQAEEILARGDADLVFLGRELLRNPYWPMDAQRTLNQRTTPPPPYRSAIAG